MASYFYYAERHTPSDYPELNQTGGLLIGYSSAEDAFKQAMLDARRDLGNTKQYTIKRFHKVED